MYAIIESGGKQYHVEPDWKVAVEKLDVEDGQEIVIDKVLLVGGEECKVGNPYVKGATVKAKVLEQGRGKKVIVFKRRRRKDSKCKHGHRQDYTMLLVQEINI